MKPCLIGVGIVVVLAACVTPVKQEPNMVWSNGAGNLTVTLTHQPCASPEVLEQVKERGISNEMFAAHVTSMGKPREACWAAISQEEIGIMDDHGDEGTLQMNQFTKEPLV